MNTIVYGHESPETAFVIQDYPYGRTLRCRKRVWVETKQGHGQRIVSQTTNPKRGDVWNAPKMSVYSGLVILYVDGNTGYLEHDALSLYSWGDKLVAFARRWGDQLNGAAYRRFNYILYTFRKVNPNSWQELQSKDPEGHALLASIMDKFLAEQKAKKEQKENSLEETGILTL